MIADSLASLVGFGVFAQHKRLLQSKAVGKHVKVDPLAEDLRAMACYTCLKVEELVSKSELIYVCPHVQPIVNLQEGLYGSSSCGE